MKTAMQELLEWFETRDMRNYQNKYAFRQGVLAKINQALEKEKEQIMEAYREGVNAGILYCNGEVFISKEEYYNQTYNQNK